MIVSYVTMNTGNGIATYHPRTDDRTRSPRYVTMNTGNGIATRDTYEP